MPTSEPTARHADGMGHQASLETKLQQIPAQPGCYLMKDDRGHIIYIGKAKVLRNRVKSYFSDSQQHPKTVRLVAEIADFDCIVTGSELEALILEANLIKKWQPRFNIRVKDDKAFPYLRITTHEEFPKIEVKRKVGKRDKGTFFGPYVPSNAVWKTLSIIKKIFGVAQCDLDLTKVYERACLYHQMGQCSAPCTRAIDKDSYRKSVDEVIEFLSGRGDNLIERYETVMWEAAEDEKYEIAARYRDRVTALQKILERQKIISGKFEDQDVIAVQQSGPKTIVQVFHVRQGKVMGRSQQTVKTPDQETEEEVLSTFLTQFYRKDTIIPQEVILQHAIEDADVIAAWLSEKLGRKVKITVPKRGHKAKLVEMVNENVASSLNFQFDRVAEEKAAAAQVAKALRLPEPPNRIECFDISNISGVMAVGSMAVWEDGKLDASLYRHFKVKHKFDAPDDYGMLREVLTRRFTGSLVKRESMPELLMVDGGKGHLNVAVAVLDECGLAHLPVIGIAKGPERKRDDLFLPNRKNPVQMNKYREGEYLLARIRDESHRFAIEYHRKLRKQASQYSILDQVPGVGPKRKKALLRHFGSLRQVKLASLEDLTGLSWLDERTASNIYELLHNEHWADEESEIEEEM